MDIDDVFFLREYAWGIAMLLHREDWVVMAKIELRLKIDESVRDEFKAACALNRKTMSEIIEEYMKSYVEKTNQQRQQKE